MYYRIMRTNFIISLFLKAATFTRNIFYELQNVDWIQPKKVLINFFMILVVIVVIAVFIGVIDFFIHKVISLIL
ncbi:MAG: preprotein translocase subunit SecE [Endomicrobium sp.]|nr:preprotein translocase subunit SecE [Endomicrobium sp.]